MSKGEKKIGEGDIKRRREARRGNEKTKTERRKGVNSGGRK